MYDWLMFTSNGVGYSLCHGVGKLESIMTQRLKLASEQAEGFFNLVAKAKQQPSIQKNFLNINCQFLTDLPVKYFVSEKKTMEILC